MKLSLSLMILAALAAAPPPSAAQEPASEHGLPDLAMYLELSADQVDQLRGFVEDLRDQVRPVAERRAQAGRAIEEEFATGAPDPSTLGALLIEVRSAEEEANALRAQSRALAQGVLDVEQRDRLNPLRLARLLEKAAKQAVGLNLIGEREPPQP